MAASLSRSPRVSWQAVVIGALTVALLWFFFRTLNVRDVWHAIATAHRRFVLLAILVTFQTYFFRTWRWQALLLPIGRARFGHAFRATVIGFTATFLLPGRVGEVLRPYLLARKEGFSAAATFATIVVERVLDLVAVLMLFSLFLLTTSVDVGREVKAGGAIAAAVALAALIVMAVFAGHPARLAQWANRVAAALPGRLASKAGGLVHTFVEGLAVMRRPAVLIGAVVLSLFVWISIALGIWLTSLAFDVTVSFTGSFLVIMFLVVGVAVPTPSGLGTFHWAYRFAVTRFFGAGADQAAAAAIVLHAVSFIPISILGLLLMAQDGLTLGGLRRLEPAAEAAESVGVEMVEPVRGRETPDAAGPRTVSEERYP